MADHSKIEWTDATWNPVLGCTVVSPGCDHCYATRTVHRTAFNPHEKVAAAAEALTAYRPGVGPVWTNNVRTLPDRLDMPLRWRQSRRVFVNSQSDLFHDAVPDDFIAAVFGVMARASVHTFQVLTKRHGRMRSLLSSETFQHAVRLAAVQLGPNSAGNEVNLQEISWPLPNVWLGVSVENQQWADIRIPALLDTPAAVRWLSCEPLLGPVDLFGDVERPGPAVVRTGYSYRTDYGTGTEYDVVDEPGIDWVVVGGESGPGARPMEERWALSLVKQCRRADIPVFVKQMGSVWAKTYGGSGNGGDWDEWRRVLRVREYPEVSHAG